MKDDVENIEIKPHKKYLISKKADQVFIDIYNVYKFITRYFREVLSPPFEFKELINHWFYCGHCIYKTIEAFFSRFWSHFMASVLNFHCSDKGIGPFGYLINCGRKSWIQYGSRVRIYESY